ncbi:uncharacterized protein EV422DRAFT_518088 [Fimicolochytrium jonesii]|uniref:uncharacterized protein n=1 Tax=Fimicolochytrium jonesii TaxID=1396493 RepID=UPI0022FE43C9|nr:uncharacterized protein EV422DRAFT_518088 [Fimicolochytrium jonesii]KAI8825256.1 hypothetical protein EV422DRAFT_518088 [Fimicolochytrium jonesii]
MDREPSIPLPPFLQSHLDKARNSREALKVEPRSSRDLTACPSTAGGRQPVAMPHEQPSHAKRKPDGALLDESGTEGDERPAAVPNRANHRSRPPLTLGNQLLSVSDGSSVEDEDDEEDAIFMSSEDETSTRNGAFSEVAVNQLVANAGAAGETVVPETPPSYISRRRRSSAASDSSPSARRRSTDFLALLESPRVSARQAKRPRLVRDDTRQEEPTSSMEGVTHAEAYQATPSTQMERMDLGDGEITELPVNVDLEVSEPVTPHGQSSVIVLESPIPGAEDDAEEDDIPVIDLTTNDSPFPAAATGGRTNFGRAGRIDQMRTPLAPRGASSSGVIDLSETPVHGAGTIGGSSNPYVHILNTPNTPEAPAHLTRSVRLRLNNTSQPPLAGAVVGSAAAGGSASTAVDLTEHDDDEVQVLHHVSGRVQPPPAMRRRRTSSADAMDRQTIPDNWMGHFQRMIGRDQRPQTQFGFGSVVGLPSPNFVPHSITAAANNRRNYRQPLALGGVIPVSSSSSSSSSTNTPEFFTNALPQSHNPLASSSTSTKPPPGQDNGLKCAICLDSLTDDPNTKLSATICGHVFCEDCIKDAVRVHKKCPICRKDLKGGKKVFRLYVS